MKIDRVNAELEKKITEIIRNDLNDPRLESIGMITVMQVQASQDLDNCKVYISVYGGEKNGIDAVKILQDTAGYIRKLLFSRMKIRKVPSLTFYIDESISYAYKISDLIGKTFDSDKRG